MKALAELPVPTATEIESHLLEIARSQPGIDAFEYLKAASASLRPDSRLVTSMIEQAWEHLSQGPLHTLHPARVVVIPDLVADTSFTHRLNESEASLGVLTAAFDLGALSRFETIRLDDGTKLEPFSVDTHH